MGIIKYTVHKESIKMFINSRGNIKYIDGTAHNLRKTKPIYNRETVNHMVMSWFTNSRTLYDRANHTLFRIADQIWTDQSYSNADRAEILSSE